MAGRARSSPSSAAQDRELRRTQQEWNELNAGLNDRMQDDDSDDDGGDTGSGTTRRGSPTKNFQVRGHVEFHRVKVNVKPPKDLSRNRFISMAYTPSGQPAPSSSKSPKKKKQYACDQRKSPFANTDSHVYDWSVRQAHIVQPKHARRSPSPRRRQHFENTQLPEVKDSRVSPPPPSLPSPTRARAMSPEPVQLPDIHKKPAEEQEEEDAAARKRAKAEKAATAKKKKEEAEEAARVEQRAAAIAAATAAREDAAAAAEEEAKHKVAEALAAAERERAAQQLRQIEAKVRLRAGCASGCWLVIVVVVRVLCYCCCRFFCTLNVRIQL
jgi:hypothetical protein